MKIFRRLIIFFDKIFGQNTNEHIILKIHLKKIKSNSWKELEDELGKYSGINLSGLNVPTKTMELDYMPKFIKKIKILEIVKQLGYKINNVEEIRLRKLFGLYYPRNVRGN